MVRFPVKDGDRSRTNKALPPLLQLASCRPVRQDEPAPLRRYHPRPWILQRPAMREPRCAARQATCPPSRHLHAGDRLAASAIPNPTTRAGKSDHSALQRLESCPARAAGTGARTVAAVAYSCGMVVITLFLPDVTTLAVGALRPENMAAAPELATVLRDFELLAMGIAAFPMVGMFTAIAVLVLRYKAVWPRWVGRLAARPATPAASTTIFRLAT